MTDGSLDIPATEIGVSVGSKVDYAKPWPASQPVPYGKLIQFWVKPIDKRPEKLKSVNYTWMVIPKEDYLIWPDTSRVVLSSGSKNQTYVVILTASYAFLDGDNVILRTAQAVQMVQVGEGTTTPPANPTGPALTGLSKLAFEWTGAVIVTNTYTAEMVKADAAKLASIFKAGAKKIRDNKFADINTIMDDLRNENSKAIGEHRNEWLPWFTKLGEFLRTGFANGTLVEQTQYADAWDALAAGLEAASSN